MMAHEKAAAVMAVRRRVAGGQKLDTACRSEGFSRASFVRWAERLDAGGIDALADAPRTGRPPLVTLDDAERAHLRKLALRANRGQDATSMTSAARWAALDPASPLRPETRAAILKPRSSKHSLPVEVRRACRPCAREIRRYRDPKAGLADGIHAAGLLRMRETPSGLVRLLPGERQVWDDASVNVGVTVPWPRGGDACSDRWGVRVARFQLLLGIDCATDFCVGYNYVMRGNDAYRAEDVVRSWHSVWTEAGAPDACVVEGGSWQSRRALEFLGAAGVDAVSAKGRPWQKLVEGWFGRLWTQMSLALPSGQVGRFRGEMRAENLDWAACREGRRDPRGLFPDLGELLAALDRAVGHLNAEPVESRNYGTWVPAEAWAASARARRELPAGLWRMALPERVVRKVVNGCVTATADDAWGGRSRMVWADRALGRYEGAMVRVGFDPYQDWAVVELAEPWADAPAGTVVAGHAERVDARPAIRGGVVAWVSGAEAARRERGAARKLVGEAVRTFDERGARAAESVRRPAAAESVRRPAAAESAEFLDDYDFEAAERRAGVFAVA